MSLPLIVLPEAEEELDEAMLWYEGRNAGLGLQFLGCIAHVLRAIQEAPDRFPAWVEDDRYRVAGVRRFPYLVVFEARTESIEIVAFANARRRPGYWRERSAP